MDTLIMNRLRNLEAKHPKPQTEGRRLRVFYGWSKTNKKQKKKAIDIAYENMEGAGSDQCRFIKTLKKTMDIVALRDQTSQEATCAAASNRMFSVYHIFLDEKGIDNSLEKAIEMNRKEDQCKGIPEKKLDEIADALRSHFLDNHPGYKEPGLSDTKPSKKSLK